MFPESLTPEKADTCSNSLNLEGKKKKKTKHLLLSWNNDLQTFIQKNWMYLDFKQVKALLN